ncbi:MAG TPA: KH domain-containing protein [Acidobacteriaceae bacterium]|nr:KH domain-containing protein [Acidobacteriaceae bacterium]
MTTSAAPSIHDEPTQELLLLMAKMLVNDSNAVELDCFEENGTIMFNLRVATADIGKVIGKQGQTARSLRTILSASGMKLRRRYCLVIEEETSE